MAKYHHTVFCAILSCLRLAALAGTLFYGMDCHAQVNDPTAVFEAFRQQAQQSYSSFRQKCLKDYTDFVRQAWDSYEGKAPIPLPKDDMKPPVVMPEKDKQSPMPKPKPVVIEEVVKPKPVLPQPEPVEPVIEQPQPSPDYLHFEFFGTKAKVRYHGDRKIKLRGVNENDVADALQQLGDGRCENMLYDCLALRTRLNLCDWAYLMMLRELSNTLYGQGSNEAVLQMAYLYMQSGYMIRFGSSVDQLYMMFASEHRLYNRVGYVLDGISYYGVDQLPNRLKICHASYPKERSMSLLVSGTPLFTENISEQHERKSKRYPDVKATVSVNKNWLDFCSTYPTSMFGDNFLTRWAMYANTPLSANVKEQLYSQLGKTIEGKSQIDAVNILLNWVQTGFEYEYDETVWGCDRAFFAEETLYYPYCDCEDRSILFTRLVRDLLGLKCILVFYPGHLAAAVCFTDSINGGDYIQLNGQRYIVSDPTYIGAPVGMTMPDMDNQTAKVILLE